MIWNVPGNASTMLASALNDAGGMHFDDRAVEADRCNLYTDELSGGDFHAT
jgi:hypothetical protein